MLAGGHLFVNLGTEIQAFALLDASDWLRREVQTIKCAAGIASGPVVAVVESVPQIGFATPGLVVLGQREIDELAVKVWRHGFGPVRRGEPALVTAQGHSDVTTFDEVLWGTWRFVLAHELGHIRQFAARVQGTRRAMEIDADHFAGQVAEALGWNPWVGEAVAEEVGCSHASCRVAYQSPEGRRETFERGWHLQARLGVSRAY